MKISTLFHRTVVSCTDRDTLEHAASLLWRRNVGCLPVVGDEGQLVGMLTDRDIALAALLQGSQLHAIAVSSVMSKEVVSCHADDEVETVLQALIARKLRRMPIVDDDRRVIGIVSLNDIARAAIAHEMPAASVNAVLTAFAVPRSLASTAP